MSCCTHVHAAGIRDRTAQHIFDCVCVCVCGGGGGGPGAGSPRKVLKVMLSDWLKMHPNMPDAEERPPYCMS